MTVMAQEYVQAPAVVPAKFGILSAAIVVEDPDPHMGFGYEYQPDFCGPARLTAAACMPGADTGVDVSGNSAAGRVLNLTFPGADEGPVWVNWGDGHRQDYPPTGQAQHTYAVAGSYPVRVDGPGWTASEQVTVSDAGTGPIGGAEATPTKIPEAGRDLVAGDPFVVYSLASCKAPGQTLADQAARAKRSLTSGEGRAVEEWLGTRLTAEADDNGGWSAATPAEALASLEHWIHCNYGGRGTIHMQRGMASGLLTDRALDTSGDQLVTRLGNLVSAGCYDVSSGDVMWATGTVMLRRGPVFSPPDPVFDQRTNDVFALAERPYAGSWECFAVAITVGDA